MLDLTTANREESLRRKLEDLEDAYGPVIRVLRRDPRCTDIALNEDGGIWATVAGEPTNEGFLSETAARRIVNIVSDIDQHPIENTLLEANLPTGERFAALLPPTVKRITFSIRLPPKKIFTLDDYVAAGIMTEAQAAILRQAVIDRENILIVGGTNSGKTTLANALLAEPAFQASRTCIIQDQDELQCSGANVVRAFTGALTGGELGRAFLRHNPDRIVAGEIRDGHMADVWIEANNTGHPGGLSTAHANSAAEGLGRIARLMGKVLVNVPYADVVEAIDLVVFIRKDRDGTRKVVEIVRPVGHDGKRFVTEAE